MQKQITLLLVSFFLTALIIAQNKTDLNNVNSNFSLSSKQSQLFSVESGFFENSLELDFFSNDGEEIYYTIDGSEPDINSTMYEGSSFLITETTVVRAKIFFDNSFLEETETNTYFINEHSELPVFSISTTPSNFWDPDTGIYVKGNNYNPDESEFTANYWQDWERPIHIEFFEQDGNLVFEQDAGVKIFGSWSRLNNQKSLTIHARDIYGEKKINYRLFPSLGIKKYKSFVLRNSGTDWQSTMFRDGFIQSLLDNEDIDKIAYRPAILFLNGAYWGIHNIREKINDNYIGGHHDVDKDNIDLLEGWGDIIRGSDESYNDFLEFLKTHDISDDTNYEIIKGRMDIDNFITYENFEIFIANTDWPSNNIKFWKPQTENGRWRWILLDTDFGFDLFNEDTYNHNTLEFATNDDSTIEYPNPPWSTFLLRKLLENELFRIKFINRFSDLSNTIFKPEFIKNRIDEFKNNINNEIDRHLLRWQNQHQTHQDWENTVETMKIFSDERLSYLKPFYINKFELEESQVINLDISNKNAGKIQINSIKLRSYPWEGEYFSNNPITLTAHSNPGYRFVEWVGDYSSQDEEINLLLDEAKSIKAMFEKVDGADPIVINEINYDSHKDFDTEDWVELYNNSDYDVDISNWIFSDKKNTNQFVIPAVTVLEADSYLVLCRSTVSFDSLFNNKDNSNIDNFIGDFDFKLSNKGELIRLFNSDGDLVDSIRYDNKLPWPKDAAGNGPTLELRNPNLDNYNYESWGISSSFGTPGRQNDSYDASLVDVKKENKTIPSEFKLYQNYPNPFNPATTIKYSISNVEDENIRSIQLKIFDVLGREITTLVNETKPSGNYIVSFNAENLSSGVYYYQLKSGSFVETKKMIVMK